MLKSQIAKYLRNAAVKHGRFQGLWKKFGNPTLEEWTEYIRQHGNLRSIGDNCAINPSVVFADPYMTHIGSNVRIAGGILLGHDGSVNMVNRARNTKYDAVGPIIIADNVFIGVGCIVLPGAIIEANTIIGAGSVVSGRVQGGGIYAGNPLRLIRSFDEHLEVLEKRTASYPWRAIVEARNGGYDAKTEPDLQQARIAHFFPIANRAAFCTDQDYVDPKLTSRVQRPNATYRGSTTMSKFPNLPLKRVKN